MVNAYTPKSLMEALDILNDNDVQIVAGGTDALIQNHNRSPLPIAYKKPVLYIANIEELRQIKEDDYYIYIGASVTLEEILEHESVPQILKDTIIEMASPAIRHTGTLAGNIGNASPAGDSLVTLYLLNSEIVLNSKIGERRMEIRDFIQGVRKIDLEPNEMITEIIINKIDYTKSVFKKVGPRRSDAISKLSFAGAVSIKNNIIQDIRFAFGAVNTTVVRRPEIECQYITLSVEEVKNQVEEIVESYDIHIKPIDDQRSNRHYRKQVCKNLLREFINNL